MVSRDSSSLVGEVAVVTGASGAIGSALSRALAARGAAVAAVDVISPDAVEDSIVAAGGQALGIAADLCDEHAVDMAAARVLDWRGRVDVLVNMAGLYYGVPRVPFWEVDVGTWEKVVAGNMRTAFLASRSFTAPMREAKKGRVVNVSSNVSVFGMAHFLHYVGAKAALIGMTRSMARELGAFNVAVNAVAPGLVHTEKSAADTSPEYLQVVVEGQCLKQPIQVEDVVNAVLFLTCEESRLITGQTLLVNGGASMGAF